MRFINDLERTLIRSTGNVSIANGASPRFSRCILNYEEIRSGHYLIYKRSNDHVHKYALVTEIIQTQPATDTFVLLCKKITHFHVPPINRHVLEETDQLICIVPSQFVGRTLVDNIHGRLYAMHTIR